MSENVRIGKYVTRYVSDLLRSWIIDAKTVYELAEVFRE